MENHWKGKTWYAYGTSMTSQVLGTYVPVLEQLSGMIAVNHGISGGSLTPDGYGKGNNKRAVMNLEDGKDKADLITVEVLPNEGVILGDIYDTDDRSFCGCLNQCLRYLQSNTEAQIVLIVMIGDHNDQPETVDPERGVPWFEYARKAELVAKLNSVPVINAFTDSGFGYARVKNRDYQIDHIHLNEKGGRNMAAFIWSKLKEIPLWEG